MRSSDFAPPVTGIARRGGSGAQCDRSAKPRPPSSPPSTSPTARRRISRRGSQSSSRRGNVAGRGGSGKCASFADPSPPPDGGTPPPTGEGKPSSGEPPPREGRPPSSVRRSPWLGCGPGPRGASRAAWWTAADASAEGRRAAGWWWRRPRPRPTRDVRRRRRSLVQAADLAHVLPGGGLDLVFGCDGLEPAQFGDVATHAAECTRVPIRDWTRPPTPARCPIRAW